ncbi:hypothetical protein [Sphingomonas sp. S-NIH.Pt15_0812]|uniref:hypothetical protein n=1 Tax=Sphingomonas sp. S-NIH.Pt15_0812 TaxID=1920129 RepID=UPI000F7D79BA|nr:hypothetical protein [Sphingomonas sp. S-NIH.Pt15_0812]
MPRKLPIAEDYGRGLFEEVRKDLPELDQAWPELNRALFWYCVAEERSRKRKSGGRMTDYWLVSIFGTYWAFGGPNFDYVAEQITARPPKDDKLTALTLAVALYYQNGRLRA